MTPLLVVETAVIQLDSNCPYASGVFRRRRRLLSAADTKRDAALDGFGNFVESSPLIIH